MAGSLRLIAISIKAILFPLRYGVVRTLFAIVLLVGAIAAAAAFIAQSWTDTSNSFTLAFLLVFTAAVVATVVLWLGAIGARSRSTRSLAGLLALTPSEFEIAVARLLPSLGYRHASVVGGPGDLAADIICNDRHGGFVVVQCKRKLPGQRVGSAEMQKFIGMISVHHEADAGVFVTTSEFTQPAMALAEQHEILLLDGATLTDLMRGKRAKNVRVAPTRRSAA